MARSPRRWAIARLCARRGHEVFALRREARLRLPDGRVVRVAYRCHCGANRLLEEVL